MTLAELREQYADKFGKKPFNGWNEEELAAKLAEPEVPGVEVLLKRAHWLGEERHEPGERLKVDFDTALRLIENGVAGRTDPLKA